MSPNKNRKKNRFQITKIQIKYVCHDNYDTLATVHIHIDIDNRVMNASCDRAVDALIIRGIFVSFLLFFFSSSHQLSKVKWLWADNENQQTIALAVEDQSAQHNSHDLMPHDANASARSRHKWSGHRGEMFFELCRWCVRYELWGSNMCSHNAMQSSRFILSLDGFSVCCDTWYK